MFCRFPFLGGGWFLFLLVEEPTRGGRSPEQSGPSVGPYQPLRPGANDWIGQGHPVVRQHAKADTAASEYLHAEPESMPETAGFVQRT
jgi:hypothetical protein